VKYFRKNDAWRNFYLLESFMMHRTAIRPVDAPTAALKAVLKLEVSSQYDVRIGAVRAVEVQRNVFGR
jgi:hypothetical protein